MPKRIQSIPAGLLSFLGIQNGDNPFNLADDVVGVVDLTPRYNARLLQMVQGGPTAGMNAKDQSVTITVPNATGWEIVAASFTALCPAASVVPALELNINGVAVAFIPGTDTVRANIFEQTVSYVPPPGLVLVAGMTINGVIRSTPNANITGLTRALVRAVTI